MVDQRAGAASLNANGALLTGLDEIIAFASRWTDEAVASEARALREKLASERFHVVVMGEFKRGKSSLINALIGQPLLPVAAVPLTSVVTLVRHGAETRAYVEFEGGHRRETAMGSIVEFISEERNPKNQKRVERVVVETAAPFLADGTILVDTPGAGSVYRHNTEVAQKYMPEADAVILVLAADPPISQTEVEFLHSVRRWARKLFVIQNKIDYLEPSDLAASLAFTRKVLAEALGDREVALIPVSAKTALAAKAANDSDKLRAAGFADLEDRLRDFLAKEKGRVLIESVAARAVHLLNRSALDIDVRLRRARVSVEEWRSMSADLRARLDAAKRRQFELTTIYTAELKTHEKRVEESLYGRVQELAEKERRSLEAYYRSVRSEPGAVMRDRLNDAFTASIESAFAGLLEREEPLWKIEFESITARYLEATLVLVNDTLAAASKVLGLKQTSVEKPRISVPPPAVWFVLEKISVWSGGFGSVPTLRLFKPVFWKSIKRKVGEVMDLNAGRLRYDYSVRLECAGREATRMVETFFESCIGALQSAASASAVREGEVAASSEADVTRLKERVRELDGLRQKVLRHLKQGEQSQ